MTNWREKANRVLADVQALDAKQAIEKAREKYSLKQEQEKAQRRADGEFDSLNIIGDLEDINNQVWEGKGNVILENVTLEASYPSHRTSEEAEYYRKLKFGQYEISGTDFGADGNRSDWSYRGFGSHFKKYSIIVGIETEDKK